MSKIAVVVVSLFIIICGGIFLLQIPQNSPQSSPQPLARIGNHSITPDDYLAAVKTRGWNVPTKEKKQQLLDELVLNELQYQAALRSGLDQDPAIQKAIKGLITHRFLEKNLSPRLSELRVSQEEITQYHRNNESQFQSPVLVRAAVLQISISPGYSDEKKSQLRQRADKARQEALQLPSGVTTFGAVANRYSDHQVSRYRGGDTGWQRIEESNGAWEQVVLESISSLENPGDISPVFSGSRGLYIAKLIAKKERQPMPLEQVRGKIHHQLLGQKKQQVRIDFSTQLENQIPTSVDYAALATLTLPEPKIPVEVAAASPANK